MTRDEKAKAFLENAYNGRKNLEALARSRREAWERLTRITTQAGRECVSSTKDPHRYDELAALDMELDTQINTLAQAEREIMETINAVKDIQYRRIIHLRYMDNRTWDDIADQMFMCKRNAFRLHALALSAVADVLGLEDDKPTSPRKGQCEKMSESNTQMDIMTFLNKLKRYCVQRVIDRGDNCCLECPLLFSCRALPSEYTIDMLRKTERALENIHVSGI